MEKIKRHFQDKDLLAKYLGIELVEVAPGSAKTRLTLDERHLNGAGLAHGGTIFTLADFALAAAANSHNRLALAVSVSISYLRPASRGDLFAEAKEVSRGGRMATYLVTVTGQDGKTVALFQGTVFRKDEPVVEDQ